MKKNILFLIAITLLAFSSCKEDEPELGDAPSIADADFTYTTSSISPNILEFKAARTDVVAVWDFGNGTTAEGPTGIGTYPNKGTYLVSLTVFTQGGSASKSDSIIIAADDPTLLDDPLFRMLSGGVDSANGKTWVIDSAYAGHFGVGPNPPSSLGLIPEWYAATANEKSNTGLYNNEYVFNINAFGFDMVTNGTVYVHTDFKDNFPGSFQNKGDYTAPFASQLGENWRLDYAAGSDTTITLSGSAFMGMHTNKKTYRIISITEDEMFLRYLHEGNAQLSWYIRLVRAGYDSGAGGGGGGSTGFSLPMDFESVEPVFTGFNGSTAAIINNPVAFGSNTSGKVLETVHGADSTSGIAVELDSKLDFSANGKITFKLFSPSAGVFKVKLEDQNDPQNSVEVDINFIGTTGWITYEADFSGSSSGVYDKLVLFPGWGNTNTNTYYIDDITQE